MMQMLSHLTNLSRVALMEPRRQLRRRQGFACPPVQSGQSLVELVLLVPIVVLALLGVANLGLAVRAQTDLAQVTQQGAQYLFRHPVTSPSSCTASFTQYSACTDAALASYLDNAGFPNSTVTTTFGSTSTGVLYETFSVSYGFALYMPVWSPINVGALHGNIVDLGAEETTIAATGSPMNITATRGPGQVQVSWTAPQPLGMTTPAVPLTLTYRLYGQLPNYDQNGLNLLTTSALSGTATITDTTSAQITMTAVLPNGLESPSSAPVVIQ
jgi:hypothetical protein